MVFEAGIHARVRYTICGEMSDVPISYFKEPEQAEADMRSNNVKPQYFVFWSPKPEETPEQVEEREGRILTITKSMPLRISTATKKGPKQGTIPGWYSAEILKFSLGKWSPVSNDSKTVHFFYTDRG